MRRLGCRAALLAAICALIAALTAPMALAAPEVGDTGRLPAFAQEVGPAGPLPSIEGTIDGFDDQDVYKICLNGGATFSASTVGRAGFDTQLFLFNADGMAVYANDDSVAPYSTLPAGHLYTPTAPGVYYLAITAFNVDPTGAGGALFTTASAGVNGPARIGGNYPIANWFGTAAQPGGGYTIDLTGAKSCIPPDETAPVIDLSSPADGAEYELGQQVLAGYSCTDELGGSGVASCIGDAPNGQPIDTASLGQKTFTVTSEDKRGNASQVTHSYRVVDRTKPGVDLRTPPDGAEYARGEQVAADYSCDDTGGSGLASCEGDVADGAAIDTSSLGEHSFSVTATDGAGNETTVSHSYRVADRTDPGVDLRTPAEGAVYGRGRQVAADYSCSDEQGGSGVASCEGDLPDGAPLDTSTPGEHSFSVTATDAAGNSSSVTHSYRVADRSGPSISLRSPADGAVYEPGQDVAADYDCADEPGGSGLASCAGNVPDGALIDTGDYGEHRFTVRATDQAGNSSERTVTYRVRFDFEGFYRPLVNRPRVNVVRAGSTVLVMFSLDGNHGKHVFAAGYPRSVAVPCGSRADVDGGRPTNSPIGHTRLRYKRGRDLYIYLWKTDWRWAGDCRQFVMKLDDGSYHRADFRFFSQHGHRDDDD